MTRITNMGRKRTYLEAGFGKGDAGDVLQDESGDKVVPAAESVPPKKKPRVRRRTVKVRTQHEVAVGPGDVQVDGATDQTKLEAAQCSREEQGTKEAHEKARRKGKQEKATASERRRLKRIAERHAHTTCLACRQQGHIVKNCPTARTTPHEDDAGTGAPGKSVVGICYRCGSRRHNLSRCKKPVDPARPLPFASCFVCSSQGHLASSCPQNEGRGIYPNGGSCKLCGQTSHFARDCALWAQEQPSKSAVMLGGEPTEGGADEDDFHVLKRRRDTVQKEEKLLQKAMPHSNVVSKPKPKVIVFK